MTENQEEVQKLADSLKSSGLAASMMDALSKAKSILGINKKDPKIKPVEEVRELASHSEEKKAKVDEIIKEVNNEIVGQEIKFEEKPPEEVKMEEGPIIEQKAEEVVEDVKEDTHDDNLSKFQEEDFNVAETGMNVNDAVEAQDVVTNDASTLKKAEEVQSMEQGNFNPEAPQMVQTNEEVKEQPVQKGPDHSIIMEGNDSEETKEEEEEYSSEKKSELTSEEKEKTDLSKLFNFGN
jgi:hypothetical protein